VADVTHAPTPGIHAHDGGRRTSALRSSLVVLQVSFALMLLVGAGLLIRSFLGVLDADTGFEEHHVLTFDLSLPRERYTPARRIRTSSS